MLIINQAEKVVTNPTPPEDKKMYNLPDDDLATQSDACREYTSWVGHECPEMAWICTPYDTWLRNPAYSGPPVPHPEENDGPPECD